MSSRDYIFTLRAAPGAEKPATLMEGFSVVLPHRPMAGDYIYDNGRYVQVTRVIFDTTGEVTLEII